MRALLLDRPGPPSTLRVGETVLPQPGTGEVRLRVEACGLNPVDVWLMSAGHPDWEWPHLLGLDVVGVVDAIGEGASGCVLGQRVAVHKDLRRQGGFADYTLADAAAVAVVPPEVDSTSAAALPCSGMTAFQAVVDRLRVSSGQTVLVAGGAGGVGGFAVQLAALTGARVIATASGANVDYVRGLGAADVIDYQNTDVPAAVHELTDGHGVDAVVDTVSSESATSNLRLLAHGGGLAAVAGAPDLTSAGFGIAPTVHQLALGAAYSYGGLKDRAHLSTMLTTLATLVADGKLNPCVGQEISLDQVPAALATISLRHGRGKYVYRANATSEAGVR